MNVPCQPAASPSWDSQSSLTENLFDRLPVGLAIFDETGVLRRCNPTWARLVCRYPSVSTGQIVSGTNIFALIPEAEVALRPFFERALAGETVRQQSIRLDNNEVVAYWDIVIAPVDRDEKTDVVVVMVDVTERERAYLELQNRDRSHVRELDTLLAVSRNLVSLEQETFLSRILDQLKAVVDYTGAIIWKLDGDEFTPLAYRGPVPQEKIYKLSAPLIGLQAGQKAVHRHEPVIIPDTQSGSPQAQAFRAWQSQYLKTPAPSIRSWMGIPLAFKEQTSGMLTLHHSQPHYYSSRQAKLALAFADYATVALENDRLYQEVGNLAALEERDRLARELHDNMAQALGYIKLQTTIINNLITKGQINEAQANLRELKQIVNDTYTDVREEIFNLRATTSLESGFLETLRDYIARYEKYYDLDIQLIIEDDESLFEFPVDVGGQIIRIIQEALINVRKHAQINRVVIRLGREQGQANVSVEDRGRGFDFAEVTKTAGSGLGLQIMRERVESIGGRLEIISAFDQGTRIVIWVPITPGK